MKITEKKPQSGPSQMTMGAAKRFSRFKGEVERSVGKADIRESGPVNRLITSWNTLPYDIGDMVDERYQDITELVSGINASASDVSEFLKYLKVYQENEVNIEDDGERYQDKAGIFLSAVINSGRDADYDLWLHGLLPLRLLGFKNSKNLVIHGDVGTLAGSCNEGRIEVIGHAAMMPAAGQKAGEFILWGDSEEEAGLMMEGGSLTIYGYAGFNLGKEMEGGSIHARGNACMPIGKCMSGGDITIDGLTELNELSIPVGDRMKGGRIFLLGGMERQFVLIGRNMYGGEIHVFGKMCIVCPNAQGKIFHNGKLVHPGEGE